MSDPIWPDSLPKWITDGYTYKSVSSVARTSMDSGRVRARRRFITTPTNLTVRTVFNRAQLGIFEAWWENAVFAGQAWCLLQVSNGAGVNNVRCRFTDTYDISPISADMFAVSASIETLSMPVSDG